MGKIRSWKKYSKKRKVLTDEDIDSIRKIYNEGNKTVGEIADIFGVCKATIYNYTSIRL